MAIVKKEINYLAKDFSQFREALINFAKTYFQNTLNDFDPSDPAMMFMEMAAYVGDVLSYYTDSNLKEMLLFHSQERKNLLALAQSMGYKPRIAIPSATTIDVYQIVPSYNDAPDYRYALKIKSGMEVAQTSNNTNTYQINEPIDFSFSSSYSPTEVSIYSTTGNSVDYYLLKKSVKATAGTKKTTSFAFTTPEKYVVKEITDTNVIGIESVTDSAGNIWYEVPYLAQDSIFVEVPNKTTNDVLLTQYLSQTPYLLMLKKVPKRFTTRITETNTTQLRFGSGVVNDFDEEITPNPDNVGMMTPLGKSKLNEAWDIANFMFTDAYGQVPTNTTLTVKYITGGGISSNALPNTINTVTYIEYERNEASLDPTLLNAVKQSLAVNNPVPATGGRDGETDEEIRQNSLAIYATQGRAVSKMDYMVRALSMDPKFGSISKVYIVQDEQISTKDLITKVKNPLTLNLYVLSYDVNKNLIAANDATKQNLVTYLDRYRMLTDSVNIKDAFIVNIGVVFEISVFSGVKSEREILLEVIKELKDYFNVDRWQINQPINKSEVMQTIANVKGVQSVLKLEFVNLFDSNDGYSPNVYDINSATINNIVYPSLDPMIFEVKYPNSDITGRVISY